MGVCGDRGLQVEGVGEVEVAVDPDPASDVHVGQRDVEVPGLRGGLAFGLGGLGVEPGLGLLDQPGQLGGADLVRERRDLGVHERRRLRGQAQGAFGDERQPPGRQVAGLEPGPAAPEPVAALDRVGQVAAPGLGGAAQRGGELDDGELRDLRAPLPTHRETGLVPLIDRPDQGVDRVHRGPACGACITCRAASSSAALWARAHASTVAGSSPSVERGGLNVEVIVRRTLPSTTDSPGPENPISPGIPSSELKRGSGDTFSSRFLPGFRDGRCATSSTSERRDLLNQRAARPPQPARRARCLRCGGLETVAARPPQPPEPAATAPPAQEARGRHRSSLATALAAASRALVASVTTS